MSGDLELKAVEKPADEAVDNKAEEGVELRPCSLNMSLNVWKTVVNLLKTYGFDYVWVKDGVLSSMTPDHVCYFKLSLSERVTLPIDVNMLYGVLKRTPSRKGFLTYSFNGSMENPILTASITSENGTYTEVFKGKYDHPITYSPEPRTPLSNEFSVKPKEFYDALKPFKDYSRVVFRVEDGLLRIGAVDDNGSKAVSVKVTATKFGGHGFYDPGLLTPLVKALCELEGVMTIHVKLDRDKPLYVMAGFKYGSLTYYQAPVYFDEKYLEEKQMVERLLQAVS